MEETAALQMATGRGPCRPDATRGLSEERQVDRTTMRARWRGFELPTSIMLEETKLEASGERYGRFVAEPFEPGFGITVGNSLRRVLVSSLEGAAATRIKIDGVLHEFSSIPGILEDVTDIVLNVKQLLVKVRSDEPQKLTLDVTKKGPITAGDITPHASVQVINPGLVICTASEEVSLKMEIEVARGRGYRTAEENDSEDREIGTIPIDSIFTPVRRVRYRTENTRVGQLTDYQKLILEIWTDGSVEPDMALVEAGKILRKHLIPFVNYASLGTNLENESFEVEGLEELDEDEAGEGIGAAPVAPGAKVDLALKLRDSSLDLSVRALNALEGNGIETVGDLVARTGDGLLQLRNFGKTTLKEVETRLEALGLSLGMASAAGTA